MNNTTALGALESALSEHKRQLEELRQTEATKDRELRIAREAIAKREAAISDITQAIRKLQAP